MFKIAQILTSFCLVFVISFASAHGESNRYLAHKQKGNVTYLGNEAVMVEIADKKVVFDPFFHNDFGVYQLVPKEIKAKLHQGIAPYNDIDIILVSHAHADHFAADEVLKYLNNHPKVSIVGPKQAIDTLHKLSPSSNVISRLFAVDLDLKETAKKIKIDNIIVEAVRIPHAGWPSRAEIENMVFRVSLPEDKVKKSNKQTASLLSVIHMGDADPKLSHFSPHAQHWKSKRTDVAFPPYWFYASTEGQMIVSQTINAVKSIGVHVPKAVPQSLKQSGFDYFSVPGETRVINENSKLKTQNSKLKTQKTIN